MPLPHACSPRDPALQEAAAADKAGAARAALLGMMQVCRQETCGDRLMPCQTMRPAAGCTRQPASD